MLERLRRHVEEQQRALRQLAREPQRRAPADGVELVAAADRVGDLERLARARQLERAHARERLVAEDARAAEVPDRLELDVDGAGVDQRAHRADLLDRDDGDAVDDLGGGHDGVAAAALGLEQRGVRAAPQRARLAVLGRDRAEPDAGRHARQAALDLGPDAGERDVGLGLVGVGEQEGELVAAEAEGAVAGAAVAQQRGELAQQAVAVLVAVAVVLELEVVDVEQRERDRRAVARGLPDGARELVLERAVVVEVGEPVAARALQGGAVERADAAAAEHVEQRQRDQQAQQHEQAEPPAERGDARGERVARAVLGEHDVAAEQRQRLHVGVAVLAVGRAGDRLPGARDPVQERVGAVRPDLAGDRRREHGAVLVDDHDVDRVGALGQRGEQLGDLAQRRRVAVAGRRLGAMLERARVSGVDGGVLADQVVLDAAADDEVLERADRAEREDQGQEQAGDDALAQPGCARVECREPHHPPASAARADDLSSGVSVRATRRTRRRTRGRRRPAGAAGTRCRAAARRAA